MKRLKPSSQFIEEMKDVALMWLVLISAAAIFLLLYELSYRLWPAGTLAP